MHFVCVCINSIIYLIELQGKIIKDLNLKSVGKWKKMPYIKQGLTIIINKNKLLIKNRLCLGM